MLKKLISAIIRAAANQPNIWTIYLNDVFKLNHHPDIEYSAFCITQEPHQGGTFDDNNVTFNLVLYYIDRLTIRKDNDLEIQSAGIDVLQNILRTVEEEQDCEITSVSYTTFNQKFKDECAGAFARVAIKWPKSNICDDGALGDFNMDFNDDFFIRVRRT